MGNSHSGPKITAQDRAILDLKLQRDKIRQYQRKIQATLDREKILAQNALANGDRTRARTLLLHGKYQERSLEKADNQLQTLQELTSTIEFAQIEKDVMFGIQQGTNVLKEIHKEFNIENVERLLGENADAITYQKEVNQLLAERTTVEDEEAIDAELDAMVDKQKQKTKEPTKQPSKDRLPEFPEAPKNEPTKEEKEEQEQEEPAKEPSSARQAVPA